MIEAVVQVGDEGFSKRYPTASAALSEMADVFAKWEADGADGDPGLTRESILIELRSAPEAP